MSIRGILLCAALVAGSTMTVCAQTTIMLRPVHDAYVNDAAPNDVNNTAYLVIGRSAQEFLPRYRTFLRFSLSSIPSNAVVSTAILRLNLQAVEGSGSLSVQVRRALANWSATTLTWNNQPASSTTVATFSIGSTVGSDYAVNLTASVQSWVNGATNNGIVLQASNESATGQVRTLASNNHGSSTVRPELVVTYSLPQDIVVTPTVLSFASVLVGNNSASKTVTVRNTGGASLSVTGTSSSSSQFVLTALPPLPASVGAGDSVKFKVHFAPTGAGSRTGQIQISSNDLDQPTVWIDCDGTGIDPEITVTPGSLVFPGQVIGSSSAPQVVRIKNDGSATLMLTSIESSSGEFVLGGLPLVPASLSPGAEGTFAVRFDPAAAGVRGGTVSIQSNDRDEGVVVLSCSGTGIVPRVTVSPERLDFGPHHVGTASPPLMATLHNESNVTVELVSLVSDDDDFLLDNPPALPVPIPAGGLFSFGVIYTPDSVRTDEDCITVRIKVTPDSVITICVPVGGIGVGPQEDLPDIVAEYVSYSACDVPVTTAALQPLNVWNTGTSSRSITSMRVLDPSSPSYTLMNPVALPAVVPPGGSLKLADIRFAPSSAGTSLGWVEIMTDASANNLVRVRCEGAGVDASVPDFFADPRMYRLSFDRLSYGDRDSVYIRFGQASGAADPGQEITVYLVSPARDDIERVNLRARATGSHCFNQVNLVSVTGGPSVNQDGELSAMPGDFIFVFFQLPGTTTTLGSAADFAFIKGGAPRGLFTLTTDTALEPDPASVPGRPGEPPRGLAAITRGVSYPGVFGDDQIIIQPRNLTELNDFLVRYGATVVDDGVRGGGAGQESRHAYLVRVNLDAADTGDVAFMAEMAGVRGFLRTSSAERTRRIFAILSQEQLEGRRVGLNPKVEFFDRPMTAEAANLLPAGGGSDAFQLNYIRDCVQKVNRAWMYLALNDMDRSAGTTVRLAVIDDGFCVNPDLPMAADIGYDIAMDDADPTGPRITADGLDWHGADVSSTAASQLNNGIGSAGSGGQVAELAFYRLGSEGFLFDVGTAIDMAVADGARVINMSFGIPCRAFGSPTFCDYEDIGFWFNLLFVCPIIDVGLEAALALVRPFLPLFPPGFACEALMAALSTARSRMAASVEDAIDAGVVLVASAGNARNDIPIPPSDIADFEIIPASLPGVIAVGEMDVAYNNTQFFGNRVDVWAMDPVRVFSPATNAANCAGAPVIRNFAGTSSASGFISGVVCMMRAVNPGLTPAEIRSIFRGLPAGPIDAVVQHALDAYAVVREAGTRAGLPDLSITSASLGFDENQVPGTACAAWPMSNRVSDDLPQDAADIPTGVSDFADRAIHTFVPGGGIEADLYVFRVPENLPDNAVYDVRISTTFPTSAGAVVPRSDAVIQELGGILAGYSQATWNRGGLFLRDDLYFAVQGTAALLSERDNVYEMTARVAQSDVQPDRYDRAPLGDPPNNSFADATLLPNIAGGDSYVANDDALVRLWQMDVQDLNFHTPSDMDFFALDLPDEAGDDCSSEVPDCPIEGIVDRVNGTLEITVIGAEEVLLYDAAGNELQHDENHINITCPRSTGFDPVRFAIRGRPGQSLNYRILITYSVPDEGASGAFLDLCNAKRDPNSPDPPDGDDSYGFISPGRGDPQGFVFGILCNPLICDPPKHDYLLFNWRRQMAFSMEFSHALGDRFNFQLRDSRFNLIATAHPEGAEGVILSRADSTSLQRIELTSLPAGLYVLRIDSAQIGSPYTARFLTPVTGAVEPEPLLIPDRFVLEQNYPNPFNPRTTIRYGLPRAGRVRLEVFSLLGELVYRSPDNLQPPGYHDLEFDGSHLASGVYLYRLIAGDAAATRRLVLIK